MASIARQQLLGTVWPVRPQCHRCATLKQPKSQTPTSLDDTPIGISFSIKAADVLSPTSLGPEPHRSTIFPKLFILRSSYRTVTEQCRTRTNTTPRATTTPTARASRPGRCTPTTMEDTPGTSPATGVRVPPRSRLISPTRTPVFIGSRCPIPIFTG